MTGLVAGTKTHQEGNATSMGTPVTLESVTYPRNATVTTIEDQDSVQSGNRSAYGIITAVGNMNSSGPHAHARTWKLPWRADMPHTPLSGVPGAGWVWEPPPPLTHAPFSFPAAVLSVSLAAGFLFALSRLCAQGCLAPLRLLVSVKGSLQPERKTLVL